MAPIPEIHTGDIIPCFPWGDCFSLNRYIKEIVEVKSQAKIEDVPGQTILLAGDKACPMSKAYRIPSEKFLHFVRWFEQFPWGKEVVRENIDVYAKALQLFNDEFDVAVKVDNDWRTASITGVSRGYSVRWDCTHGKLGTAIVGFASIPYELWRDAVTRGIVVGSIKSDSPETLWYVDVEGVVLPNKHNSFQDPVHDTGAEGLFSDGPHCLTLDGYAADAVGVFADLRTAK